MVNVILLSVLLLYCFITDLKSGKIYNHATLPGIILGIALNAWLGGMAGFKSSLLGLVAGFCALLLFFYFGAMGGGDIKLMAAIGAIMGYPFIINALVYTALAGGIVGLFVAARHGILLRSFKNIFGRVFSLLIPGRSYEPLKQSESITVPYGVAIAGGTVWALLA